MQPAAIPAIVTSLSVGVWELGVGRCFGTCAAIDMEPSDWIPRKPYDLRERLFDFGLLTIRIVQFLHTQGPVATALSAQILKCGTSCGANYEEADDGSSKRDALAKKKIALREVKETRFRLRLVRRVGFLKAEHDPFIQESDELVKILSRLIRKESV